MSALLKDRNSDDKNLSTHSSRNRRSTQKWRDASPAALVKAHLNNLDRLFTYVQDQPAFYRADFEMEALFAEVEAIAYSCESLNKPPLPKKVFVFARQTNDAGETQLVLCVDADADQLSLDKKGQPLFDQGEMTDVTKRALGFCNQFEEGWQRTRKFVEMLQASGVVTPQQVKISKQGMSDKVLQGLQMVDGERLAQLPDEQFLTLRGCLPAVYAHLAAKQNFQRLA